MKKFFIPPVLFVASVLLMILLYLTFQDFNLIKFPLNLIGLLPAYFGISFLGKSRDLFLKHETSHRFDKANKLITEGIFEKTRNPMYVGMILLLVGIAIGTTNFISFVIPLLFFLMVNYHFVLDEESDLEMIFGIEYLNYKKNVRRWF